jgi:predicted membrane channel-forming protein YqfA (hemolysin III family)
VIVLYVWVSKPQSAAFVLPFFVLYAIFAVFETKALIKNTDTRQETDD